MAALDFEPMVGEEEEEEEEEIETDEPEVGCDEVHEPKSERVRTGNDRLGERILTKYERTNIISARAKQIQQGGKIHPTIYSELLIHQLMIESGMDRQTITTFLKDASFKNFKDARELFRAKYPDAPKLLREGIYTPERIAELEFLAKLGTFTRHNHDGSREVWRLEEMIY